MTTGCVAGALGTLLDRLQQAYLLVDAEAQVLFLNRMAADLVAEERGLRLQDGVLHATRSSETVTLKGAIETCARGAGAGVGDRFFPVTTADGGPPLAVAVLGLAGTSTEDVPVSPMAAVVVADPATFAPPSARQLQDHFRLTAAEAALAIEVISGAGLQACARRLGVSRNTASTHLRHIFEKTATGRQAELVHALLSVRHGIRAP